MPETHDLYPTPTRIALLWAMYDGNVSEDWFGGVPDEIRVHELGRHDRVTAKVREMKAAGWCETNPVDADLHVRGIVPTLTGLRLLERFTR